MTSENLKSPSVAEQLLNSGHWNEPELVETLLREYYPQVYRLAYALLEQEGAARQAAVSAFANALADRDTTLKIFPQTPDDKPFWTASTMGSDDGEKANGLSFAESTFGEMDLYHKSNTNLYVRCVYP